MNRRNNQAAPAPLREISVEEILIEADELLERVRLLDATREYLRGFQRRGEKPPVQRLWVDGVERYVRAGVVDDLLGDLVVAQSQASGARRKLLATMVAAPPVRVSVFGEAGAEPRLLGRG